MATTKKEFYYTSNFGGLSKNPQSLYKVNLEVSNDSAMVIIADAMDNSVAPVKIMNFIEDIATDIYKKYLKDEVVPEAVCWVHDNPYVEDAYYYNKTKYSIVSFDWNGTVLSNPNWLGWENSMELLNFEV